MIIKSPRPRVYPQVTPPSVSDYTSATNFTIEGDTITGYTGGMQSEITIPYSYSLGETTTETTQEFFPDYFGFLDYCVQNEDSITYPITAEIETETGIVEVTFNSIDDVFNGEMEYMNVFGITATFTTTTTPILDGTDIKITRIDAIGYLRNVDTVNILDNIEYIDYIYLMYCMNINIDENNKYYSSINGVLYNKNGSALLKYGIGKTETTFNIPNGVHKIASQSIYQTKLQVINVSETVDTLESRAFQSNHSLTQVNFSGTALKEIPSYCFQNSSIQNLVIPNGVVSVGSNAFAYCGSLQSITFGSSFNGIIPENGLFTNDNSLININVVNDNPNCISVSGVLFNKNQDTILCYPPGRTGSYTIPNGVMSIGKYSFYQNDLSTITLQEGIINIDEYAFSDSTNLTAITIPSSVTSIGNKAFNNCFDLETVTLLSTTPPTLYNTTSFYNGIQTFYIPAGTLSAYQNAQYWSSYASKFVELSE